MSGISLSNEEFAELRTNGIKVNYWSLCQRKVWLFAKGLRMEPFSERVRLGRLLHKHSYSDLSRRELLIDTLINVDLVEDGKVLEVKYSKRMAHAARLQVAYYLMYLRWLGAGDLTGEIRFPRERRKEEVRLTPELETQVTVALHEIKRIESLSTPPQVSFMPICRACAYAELCWG